jgi:mannose-6-phosphate isomerase-like protein (cupin superfamily)
MCEEKELPDTRLILHNNHESYNDLLPDFDLPGLIQIMKHDMTREKGELNSMILFKSEAKTIILVKLNQKAKIKSFQENRSLSFRVIEGRLNLHIRKGSLIINNGELLILYEKTPYSLDSMEDTVFLLTLAS